MKNTECNIVFRKKLLETFYFLEKFFKENNIRYYACGGTALGAVRHHGLIPWDDDIDLYVPREDYDKLSSINDKLLESGYNFACFENTRDYYLPFGKIENKSTSLWERRDFKYITGVFVDIFPLDYFSGTKESVAAEQNRYYRLFSKYQKSIRHISCQDLGNMIFHGQVSALYKSIKPYFYHPFRNTLYRMLMGEIESARKRKGEWCVCTPQWPGRIFKTVWFDNAIEIPFENTSIKVPSNYEEYLTLLYGDYLTPPPPEERISAHDDCRCYLNLKESLTYGEIQKRIRQGERIVI